MPNYAGIMYMLESSPGQITRRHSRVSAIVYSLLSLCLWLSPSPSLAQEADSAAVDSTLIRELEREMAGFGTAKPNSSHHASGQVSRAAATTNPDISVIGNFGAWYLPDEERSLDFAMNEIETSLRGAIDPYARGDVFIAIANEDGEFVFELEEAYVTTLSLPYRLQARAGKFRSTFGKTNEIHPHALPYPDTPLMNEYFLGEEGLKDEGVGLSWLVPNRTFYQDLTFEFTRGPAENTSFERSESDRFLYLGKLKNFWDLTPNATLELGLTGAAGPNDLGATTTLAGLDLTYRWKPLQRNTYRSFTLQFEGLMSNRRSPAGVGTVNSIGLYALVQYQLSRRWHLVGRYDHSDLPDNADWNENAIGAYLGWYATEFQKTEFGVKTRSGPEFDRTWEVLARLIFVLGTHGAHEY